MIATIAARRTRAVGIQMRAPSRTLLWAFQRYLRHYLPKHFHSLAVSFAVPLAIPRELPLIVYANHASWWDPLVALLLSERLFPDRTLYAPIDATAVERYKFFERMGFFGVEQHTLRGAAQFLRQSRAILQQPGASIWLTPEGHFADPRDEAARFEPGLAHLAAERNSGLLLPIALEYPFWEERLPEALVRFGQPLDVAQHRFTSKAHWDQLLRERLRETQRQLAALSIARDESAFQIILRGRAGTSGIYDWLRRGGAWLRGQRFQAQHGEKMR